MKTARQQRRTNPVHKGGSNLAKKIWPHGGVAGRPAAFLPIDFVIEG